MSATPQDVSTTLAELDTLEEFLDYFGIPFDPAVVQVNRLHILQRFHDYLRSAGDAPEYDAWRSRLARAYEDFVVSDAQTEGVFAVFRRARGIATIPLESIGRRRA